MRNRLALQAELQCPDSTGNDNNNSNKQLHKSHTCTSQLSLFSHSYSAWQPST